jgi:SpoVK/Ycf46/Vps4 family AAA+-type ATPase
MSNFYCHPGRAGGTPWGYSVDASLASYSMILYGPPGTSKTTVAKKLAQELRWPLLVLNQSTFLSQGIDSLDSEAERIFMLVSHLKKTVVLFDEVEELVEERSSPDKLSRLLTTSMLPRIHHLRDERRVVFIFATNHVESIDRAITRLGRFDIIRSVWPPELDERKAMLDSLLDELHAEDEVKAFFDQARTIERTNNFGYKDLEALVRRVLVASRVQKKPIDVRVSIPRQSRGL